MNQKATANDPRRRPAFAELAVQQAFSWLLVGNLVGLLMALLLWVPASGELLGSLSYGRWAAVHIDVQMYGWCSLPLLAMLFHLYAPPGNTAVWAGRAIRIWSGALMFLAISSLTGHSSGKVFVEWSGAARWVFALALVFTSLAVIVSYVQRLAAVHRGDLHESRLVLLTKGLGILILLPVPYFMVVAASPELYPPINPESGGATSTSTLASVLGVGLLLALSPYFVGLRPRDGGRFARIVFGVFALHFVFAMLLGPGDHSHREPLQVAALFSSLIWLPLLWEHLRRFPWPASSRLWVLAMAGWALVLAGTGVIAGLPGMAEKIKYTNTLVGHVHAAAAGLVTAWLFVLLDVIAERRDLPAAFRNLFADRPAFFAWQLGSVLHIGALLLVGQAEGTSPQILWSGSAIVSVLYGLRFFGGVLMTLASWRLLRAALYPASLEFSGSLAKEGSHEILDPVLLPAGRHL